MKKIAPTKSHKIDTIICLSLIRHETKNFSNINTSDITDNKTFWMTVKLFFTDKILTNVK